MDTTGLERTTPPSRGRSLSPSRWAARTAISERSPRMIRTATRFLASSPTTTFRFAKFRRQENTPTASTSQKCSIPFCLSDPISQGLLGRCTFSVKAAKRLLQAYAAQRCRAQQQPLDSRILTKEKLLAAISGCNPLPLVTKCEAQEEVSAGKAQLICTECLALCAALCTITQSD